MGEVTSLFGSLCFGPWRSHLFVNGDHVSLSMEITSLYLWRSSLFVSGDHVSLSIEIMSLCLRRLCLFVCGDHVSLSMEIMSLCLLLCSCKSCQSRCLAFLSVEICFCKWR
jgi:hypothetical protein